LKQKNTAKGIDKWDLLPYNISREATDTVASPQIKEIIAFDLVGSGRLFLFIILEDKNDESRHMASLTLDFVDPFPCLVLLYIRFCAVSTKLTTEILHSIMEKFKNTS